MSEHAHLEYVEGCPQCGDPLDWAGDWHIPGLASIIREEYARSAEYLKKGNPLLRDTQ